MATVLPPGVTTAHWWYHCPLVVPLPTGGVSVLPSMAGFDRSRANILALISGSRNSQTQKDDGKNLEFPVLLLDGVVPV